MRMPRGSLSPSSRPRVWDPNPLSAAPHSSPGTKSPNAPARLCGAASSPGSHCRRQGPSGWASEASRGQAGAELCTVAETVHSRGLGPRGSHPSGRGCGGLKPLGPEASPLGSPLSQHRPEAPHGSQRGGCPGPHPGHPGFPPVQCPPACFRLGECGTNTLRLPPSLQARHPAAPLTRGALRTGTVGWGGSAHGPSAGSSPALPARFHRRGFTVALPARGPSHGCRPTKVKRVRSQQSERKRAPPLSSPPSYP